MRSDKIAGMSTVTETLDNADAELAEMAKEDARRFMQSDGSQDEMGFAARRFRERDLETGLWGRYFTAFQQVLGLDKE